MIWVTLVEKYLNLHFMYTCRIGNLFQANILNIVYPCWQNQMFHGLMKEFVEYKIISNWVIKMRAAEIRFIKCARNLSYLNQRQRRLENVIAKLKKIIITITITVFKRQES